MAARSSEDVGRPATPSPLGGATGADSARPALASAVGGPSAEAQAVATLPADVDLHARPAAQFVRAAMGFSSRIALRLGEREADAKSLLSVLALGAKGGTSLALRADGDDAPVAVEALAGCLSALRE